MRRRMKGLPLLGLLALGACAQQPQLEDMAEPVLRVEAFKPRTLHSGPTTMYLSLFDQAEDCSEPSSEIEAFVDDVRAPLAAAGGHVSGGFLGGGGCFPASYLLEGADAAALADAALTRVRMTDGDSTFLAEVQSLCAERTFLLRSPADGIVRAGDEVDVEWAPATDALHVEALGITSQDPYQELLFLVADGGLRLEANHLRFRMPAVPEGMEGPATLVIASRDGYYRPAVTRCEGFTECHFSCDPGVQTQLELTLAR
jgi:hypothetical protein